MAKALSIGVKVFVQFFVTHAYKLGNSFSSLKTICRFVDRYQARVFCHLAKEFFIYLVQIRHLENLVQQIAIDRVETTWNAL